MRAPRRHGFTLLESVVAISILAMALMALYDMNAGAMRMHSYTKRLTVATMLARSKMTDLEQHLYDKGLAADDEDDGGDFADEGWPTFKWRAKIIAPKTEGISPEQVIGSIFNIPLGTPGTSNTGGDSLAGALGGLLGGGAGGGSASGGLGGLSGLLGGLLGGGGAGGGASAAAGGAPGAGGLLSALGPLASTQFQQMVNQITQSVREIHLTVSWKEGKQVESLDLVTHVVATGPGSDRNGLVVAGQSAASTTASGVPPGPMVDAVTGVSVPNPTPGPNGTWLNPATGNQAVPGSGIGATPGAPPPPGIRGPVPAPGGLGKLFNNNPTPFIGGPGR